MESCVPIRILLNHHCQKWSYWVGVKSSTWKKGVFTTLRRGNHCRECGNIYNTHARLLASTFWYWKYSHGIQEGSGKHPFEICQTHHKEKNMPWHQTLATTVKQLTIFFLPLLDKGLWVNKDGKWDAKAAKFFCSSWSVVLRVTKNRGHSKAGWGHQSLNQSNKSIHKSR